MKKYLMMAIAAIAAMTMTVSCDSEYAPDTFLGEVRVSSSTIAFTPAGSSATINVDASAAWQLTDVPEWLTANPSSGSAGSSTVTFTATETAETREGSIKLVCDGKTQIINYIQMCEKTELKAISCAEVAAVGDGTTVRTKGVVTAIANTTYGNFYLQDETGSVYVYGCLYDGKTQNNPITNNNIEVGDEVTVEGPKKDYNGTIELIDVTVINVEKSLIKCDSLDVEIIPLEGGVLTAYITCKGSGVSIDIPEDAQSWLSVIGVSNSTVKFRAAANEGGDRSTTVVLHTTDGKKDYTTQVSIAQKGAIVACSVAEFLAAAEGDAQFRLTAAVTSVSGKNVYVRDYSGDVLVYNPNLNGQEIKVGDMITVVGKRSSYKGNPQMGNPTVENVVPVTTISVADFRAAEESKEVYYLLTGKVIKSEEENTKFDLETYGNFAIEDETGNVYVYGVMTGVGGASKQFGTLGIQEGDTISIIGYRTSYKGLIQMGGAMFFEKK